MYNELTEADIKKMQEELNFRTKVERPRISELIIEAKAHGDLRKMENIEKQEEKKAEMRAVFNT